MFFLFFVSLVCVCEYGPTDGWAGARAKCFRIVEEASKKKHSWIEMEDHNIAKSRCHQNEKASPGFANLSRIHGESGLGAKPAAYSGSVLVGQWEIEEANSRTQGLRP